MSETADLFAADAFAASAPDIPGRRFTARAAQLLIADDDGFVTREVERIAVELDGVPGDRHSGHARPACSRVPWYPRGAPIRNARQLSLVAPDELGEIARRMNLPEVRPEWIGANLLIDGVTRLTRLPPGTRLHFPSGAALAIEGENGPCRHAGAAIGAHYPDREGLDVLFPQVARGLRGLVAWVERAGELTSGEIEVRVPAQHLWRG
jgi:hypothetical protein